MSFVVCCFVVVCSRSSCRLLSFCFFSCRLLLSRIVLFVCFFVRRLFPPGFCCRFLLFSRYSVLFCCLLFFCVVVFSHVFRLFFLVVCFFPVVVRPLISSGFCVFLICPLEFVFLCFRVASPANYPQRRSAVITSCFYVNCSCSSCFQLFRACGGQKMVDHYE